MEDCKLIYHYTSLDVLSKIISTRKLRFTQLSSLSDTSEYKYGIQLLKDKIVEYERTNHIIIIDKFNVSLLDEFTFLNQLCSISFTENGNDNMFWNSYYVPKEDAVSIGFNRQNISNNQFICNKCIYGDPYPKMNKHRYEWFRNIFDIKNIIKLCKNIEYIHITFQTAHIKNIAFKSENEWCAVSFMPEEKEQNYFIRNNKRIQCYDQLFNLNSINEIYIGPSVKQNDTYKCVNKLISLNNMACKIIKSDIPLEL